MVEPPSQQNQVNVRPQQDPSFFKCKSNFTSLKYIYIYIYLGYGNAPNGYGSKQKGTSVSSLKKYFGLKVLLYFNDTSKNIKFTECVTGNGATRGGAMKPQPGMLSFQVCHKM